MNTKCVHDCLLLGSDALMISASMDMTSNHSNISDVQIEEVTFRKGNCGVNDGTFDFVVNALVIGLLCLFGVVGNSLSIYVLQRDPNSKVAMFLLQSLAVADNLLLVVSFLALAIWKGLLHFIHTDKDSLRNTMVYIPVIINPLGAMAQTATIWLTVLLALNRYLAVCKPFQAYILCTLKRAKIQVFCVSLFAVCFNVPRFFQHNVITVQSHVPGPNGTIANETHLDLEPTSLGPRTMFGIVYTNGIYSVLVLMLPLLLLIVLNTQIIRELRNSRLHRASTGAPDTPSDDNISFIMILIIVVFIVCQLPDRLLQIFSLLIFNKHPCSLTKSRLMGLCNTLVIVNSSTNFVIYFLFRRSFRRILRRRLCPGRRLVDNDGDSFRSSCTSKILMTAISGEDLRSV